MKYTVHYLFWGFIWLLQVNLAVGILAQPANDDYANRIFIDGDHLSLKADAAGASNEVDEPRSIAENGDGSLWWEWTAPASGRYTISTVDSDLDTVLAVFVGGNLEALELVAFNDDEDLLGGVFTSRITFFASEGIRYPIAIAALVGSLTPGDTAPFHVSIAKSATESLEPWALDTLGDDRRFDSENLLGNLMIVDFWATWCVPCRAEIPIFNELQETFGDRGLTVLGVSVDSIGGSQILAFASDFPMEFPIALTSGQLEEIFGGVVSIPTAFIIDGSNNLINKHIGFRDRDFWFQEVESLIAPKSILISSPELEMTKISDEGLLKLRWTSSHSSWAIQAKLQLDGHWEELEIKAEIVSNDHTALLRMRDNPFQFFRVIQK